MVSYSLLVDDDALNFINSLDLKSQRIVKKNLDKLVFNPYPGKGIGDKEKLMVKNRELFRLHISRSFTAFYVVLEKEKTVKVVDVFPIDLAHKLYDR